MVDRLLSLIAPHHCYGCGYSGTLLCYGCKNYILDEPFRHCLVCLKLVKAASICSSHQLPYQTAWSVGWRGAALEKLIDGLKFERRLASSEVLADILNEALPVFDQGVTVVPIPTTAKNIRKRGYDHMLLIAKALARRRKWQVAQVLTRNTNTTQHFAKSAKVRREQAKDFFRLNHSLSDKMIYLLVDDIYTTGATLLEAARLLQEGGAKHICVVAIARQRPN